MAPVQPAGPPALIPASPGAKVTAPLFGGYRGGRKRKDGLPPGSPQAIAADREKDRLRKERQRDREAAAAEPAALPSVAGAAQAPPGVMDPGAASAEPQPLPWESKLLEPLFAQLLPTLETMSVNQVTGKAAKAKLPGDLVVEIERDAHWPEPAKKALQLAGPQVAAKWLNWVGISAENQPEVICGTAIAAILAGQAMLLRRLDKLILASGEAKPAEKKS